MAKNKENLLRQFAKDSFDLIPEGKDSQNKQKRGIREGTKGISGARVIDIERIKPDPDQPRKTWDNKKLNELAVSIKTHGVLQPITVEYIEEDDYFKVINGERRYRASKIAGIKEIPCLIRNIDQKIKLIHQLIENIQRQDLAPIEEAESINTLIQARKIENPGYSQREASKDLGLPKSYVNEMLSLLKLPDDIKKSVRTSDTIPKSLLLLLLRQSDEKNIRTFFNQIKEGNLTVREAKNKINRDKKDPGRPKNFEYKFESPEKDFVLKIKFNKSQVKLDEVTTALKKVLNNINQ
ncbi:MAG: ParB/RepB/Spo0J family partition protein [Atribacterota bacterium]|nr:ParB/RepB/Spo0J family partition protein [Atribacterota bacterium]